jgi:hypothetical protein
MALSDADRREIANLIASEIGRYAGQRTSGAIGTEAAAAAERATAPLTNFSGNWKLATAASGGATEAAAISGPVQFDRLENNLHAGGRVLVTNFAGRLRQNVEAAGTRAQQGEQFSGILVLAHDPTTDKYTELYADDQGKVSISTADKYEIDGNNLRLYHSNYVAEYGTTGPRQFRFAAYERAGGPSPTEASRGAPIKSASLTRA